MGALDAIDWQLLSLMADAVAPALAPLAAAAGISEAETSKRIGRLREDGVIGSVQARITPERVGLPITAFFIVRVAQTEDSYQAIDHLIREFDQVQEAHAVSGQYDWINQGKGGQFGIPPKSSHPKAGASAWLCSGRDPHRVEHRP